jgi:hypothetical protein
MVRVQILLNEKPKKKIAACVQVRGHGSSLTGAACGSSENSRSKEAKEAVEVKEATGRTG